MKLEILTDRGEAIEIEANRLVVRERLGSIIVAGQEFDDKTYIGTVADRDFGMQLQLLGIIGETEDPQEPA
jgi:hypothetical protein